MIIQKFWEERTIKYVSARVDSRYSAKESGDAERLEAMIYPSALLTAKLLPIPEERFGDGKKQILKYTKHYYASTSLSTGIGYERIASFLGTGQSVGLYCDSETTLIPPMDAKVLEAGAALEDVFAHFDKTFDLDTPHLYGSNTSVICAPTQITQSFGAYWYHPDHLGSSSYITNLNGEISQHLEYLPFGETLVEEHLNSNNSPYKFNAKEFDAETGNYYYGARYYSPKYNLMLSIDPLYEMYPGVSPFAYTLQNPVRYVDPTGMFVEDNDDDYGIDNKGNITLIRETKDNFDRLYNSDDVMVGQVNKGYLSDGINIEEDGLFLDVKNKEDFLSYLSFTLDLSIEVNKEIGGFILDSESGFDDIYITQYKESEPHKAVSFRNFANSSSYSIKNKELNLKGNKYKANAWFHTHPDIMSPGYGSSRPSGSDIIVTGQLQIPGVVLGGWGGIGLMNIDGSYIRWGK